MKLIIAEKPSLGRAIAAGLGGNQKTHKTHIECGDYVVTWCFGHLLELKMPNEYNPEYKNWSARPIPFVPERWERLPVEDKKAQVSAIKKLIGGASVVVNAGDPDREGSMLVDSLISFLGWKGDVWRLLIADVNIKAVKRALDKMDKFNSTAKLSNSADARAKADWLYGINLTTAYTLAARAQNYDGVLNVGRVQTPVLGLVVRRKLERDNFKPHNFFSAVATLEKGIEFKAKAKVVSDNDADFDSDDRLINKAVADLIAEKCSGKKATVKTAETETAKSNAPAPYSLSELQKEANKKLGLTATETLAAAQELYQSGATTYPRSDCSYISTELWNEAQTTLNALKAVNTFAAGADSSLKHTCVNDAKVGAHHAIIPTDNVPDLAKLSSAEKSVYELIVSRYVALFYPAAIEEKTKLVIEIEGVEFHASGTVEKERGWRNVLAVKEPDNALPIVEQGESLNLVGVEVETSTTTPPKDYTEATLLSAMTNIAKHVTNDELKKILKETDGLGTEATRAAIIESLIKREYMQRDKKNIVPTEKGIEFILQLPEEITLPDMTAKWELLLSDIAEDKGSKQEFLAGIAADIERLAKNPNIKITGEVKEAIACPQCSSGHLKRWQRKDKSGFFWSCSDKECGFICDDNRGKPAESVLHACPECKSKLARRKGSNGWFWSCTGYKDGCKFTTDDNKGKPAPKTEKPAAEKTDSVCPDCGKPMAKRKGKYGDFLGCTGYPECKKIIKI